VSEIGLSLLWSNGIQIWTQDVVVFVQAIPRYQKGYTMCHGHVFRIYYSWSKCKIQVKDLPMTKYKGFRFMREANEWLK
jgi:hypothetical protein